MVMNMTTKSMSWEEAVLWLKRQPEQQELVRSCFFDDPLLATAVRYYRSTEWQSARALLPAQKGRALDVGAGLGISSYALARDGWNTLALEPDESQIVGAGAIRSLAKESGLPIIVEQSWGEQLPFGESTFDLVHCRQVLHHARDLRQLCREIGRVLKPGGTLLATREHVISRPADLPAFLAQHPLHRFYGGESAYLLVNYLEAIKGGGIQLSKILNPYASDINLFPETKDSFKQRLAKKLYWPWPRLIPDVILVLWGALSDAPGRLYTFLGKKSHG